jgi:hypothetical protein
MEDPAALTDRRNRLRCIRRIDLRDNAYGLAARGEYGPIVQKQWVKNSLPGKYPLSAAQKDVIDHIAANESNP